jgi:hypothetical protein
LNVKEGPNEISDHSGNILVLLEVFNKLGFMSGLDSGKALGALGGGELFVGGKIVEFSTGVGLAEGLFALGEDSDLSADGDGGVLERMLALAVERGLPCYHQ